MWDATCFLERMTPAFWRYSTRYALRQRLRPREKDAQGESQYWRRPEGSGSVSARESRRNKIGKKDLRRRGSRRPLARPRWCRP